MNNDFKSHCLTDHYKNPMFYTTFYNFRWQILDDVDFCFISTIMSNVTFGCYIECYYWHAVLLDVTEHLTKNYKTSYKTRIFYSQLPRNECQENIVKAQISTYHLHLKSVRPLVHKGVDAHNIFSNKKS